MVKLTDTPLDLARVCGHLPLSQGSGSVLVHYAVVKDTAGARRTAGIRFEPAGDVEAEMRALEAELRHRWKVDDIVLVRRLGSLEIGEVISVVAVAAAGRDDAFGACHDAISGFKKMKSLKKQELFVETD